ncbi:MAG: esterase/lipase family protein [Cyclonatronaceae bacterium]
MKRLRLDFFPQPSPILLKRPVLLCHGFGAMGNMAKRGLLDDVAMMYRAHGILAFAPNIVPYARIETRAEAWMEAIAHILEETGCNKIDVIAHSMGGLDMRYAIHHLGAHAHVHSLTTVSTPHRGTALADFMLRTPEQILNHLARLTNWFGNNVYPEIPSDVLGALEQLRPAYIQETFNPNCPNHPDVQYQSVTASCGKGTTAPINSFLIPFNKHIYEHEGPNDGYVPVASARLGRLVGQTQLSHPEQIKISLSNKKIHVWEQLWLDIARSLKPL